MEIDICPHCNGRSEIKKISVLRGTMYAVVCTVCFCRSPVMDTPEAAVKKWNARGGSDGR